MITTSTSIAVLINGKKRRRKPKKPLKTLERQLNSHAKKFYQKS